MRAEAPGPEGPREAAGPQGAGFDEVLRLATERAASAEGARRRRPQGGPESRPPAAGGAAPVDSGVAPPPGAGEATPPAAGEGRGAALTAARVQLAVAALRAGERPSVEIAAAEGLGYTVALCDGGVELRARAAWGLEGVARADLHAAEGWLRRLGIRVARAVVLRERPSDGGRRALTPPRRRR